MSQEILARLKRCQIDRKKKGPLFATHEDCLAWADEVAPLIKIANPQLYPVFMEAYSVVTIKHLSSETIMAHLNRMIGIQNQVITELEVTPPAKEVPISSESETSSVNRNVEYPEKVTIPWLVAHLSITQWIAAIVFLVAVFMAGVKLGDSALYQNRIKVWLSELNTSK